MKTLLFLLTVWGVLGLVQCKKDADVGMGLDQDIKLKLKQRVTVTASDAGVQLTLTELSDSRCPSDVNCVWGGEALAKVELRDAAGVVQNAALGCLGSGKCRDSAAVVLDAASYWLVLTAVTPYPSRTAPQPSPKMATLRLTRQ